MDPRETESMAWPLLVYARILSSFCSISAPFERSSFFFFFFFSFPKNREIPFNSLLENEPSPLPPPLPSWVLGIVAPGMANARAPLAQFFLVKGPFDFSFLSRNFLSFLLLFYSGKKHLEKFWRSFGEVGRFLGEDILEKREKQAYVFLVYVYFKLF